MTETIKTHLRLDRDTIVRGESAWFDVVVENVSRNALEEVKTLARNNRALLVEATGPTGTWSAHQRTPMDREGVHAHGARGAAVTDLPPGGKLTLRGDLLDWLGELPPGAYQVVATYRGGDEPVASRPVDLRVVASDPIALDTPRYGQRLAQAPLTTAAVIQFGREGPDAGRVGLFYQQHSQNLPRRPVHSARAVVLKEPVVPLAATLAAGAVPVGHLVWSEKRALMVATIDPQRAAVVTPTSIAIPYRGEAQSSPLTARSGVLHVPFREEGGARACVISVGADGAATVTQLDLGRHAPMGPHAFLWQHDARLHALWARPHGRELVFARLPLDDVAAGFNAPTAIDLDRPILWIEGCMDADAPLARRLPDAEAPPPDVVAWLLVESPGGLDCVHVNLTLRQPRTVWSLPLPPGANPQMVSAVVTNTREFAFVLQDAKGALHYGSTTTKQLRPLAELIGGPIDLRCFPGLVAAGADGVRPWIHLRYVDRQGRRVAWHKLEPQDAHDPMDGPVQRAVDEDEDDDQGAGGDLRQGDQGDRDG